MKEIDPFLAKKPSKPRYEPQRKRGFSTDGAVNVLAAFGLQLRDHSTTARNDDRPVSRENQGATNLQGPTLDAAAFQRRQ